MTFIYTNNINDLIGKLYEIRVSSSGKEFSDKIFNKFEEPSEENEKKVSKKKAVKKINKKKAVKKVSKKKPIKKVSKKKTKKRKG
jgi:hypothetical protein